VIDDRGSYAAIDDDDAPVPGERCAGAASGAGIAVGVRRRNGHASSAR
jgi:hypothetical protein